MKKYFKFIGFFTLILWFIGLIAFIVYFAKIANPVVIEVNGEKMSQGGLDNEGKFFYIIMLLFYIVIGPSLSLLFISHSNKLEETKVVSKLVEHDEIMKDEINKQKTIKQEEKKAKTGNYEMKDGYIIVDGNMININYITDVVVEGKKVKFKFYSKSLSVDCVNSVTATHLASQLIKNK